MTHRAGVHRLLLLAALLGPALPGCISYGLDYLPPAGELPAPLDPPLRPSVAYSVSPSVGSDYQVSGRGGGEFGLRDAAGELASALTLSGQFRSVEPASADVKTDLALDVSLVVDANDVILAASALTLFIIPTWRTVTFDLVAEVRAADGRWKRYHLTDAARDINWLPFILGMSFAPWGGAYADVRDNLYATLLQQLREDGFLGPAGTQPPG